MIKSMRKSKKTSRKMKNGNTIFQNVWDAAKAVLTGNFIVIKLTQEITKISNEQTNLLPKRIRKRRTKSAEGRK